MLPCVPHFGQTQSYMGMLQVGHQNNSLCISALFPQYGQLLSLPCKSSGEYSFWHSLQKYLIICIPRAYALNQCSFSQISSIISPISQWNTLQILINASKGTGSFLFSFVAV